MHFKNVNRYSLPKLLVGVTFPTKRDFKRYFHFFGSLPTVRCTITYRHKTYICLRYDAGFQKQNHTCAYRTRNPDELVNFEASILSLNFDLSTSSMNQQGQKGGSSHRRNAPSLWRCRALIRCTRLSTCPCRSTGTPPAMPGSALRRRSSIASRSTKRRTNTSHWGLKSAS